VAAAASARAANGAAAVACAASMSLPSVPAAATTPAKPVAEGVAAPVEARSAPTVVVPTVVPAIEEELGRDQRCAIAGPVDAGKELSGGRGLGGASRNGVAEQRRGRHGPEDYISHAGIFR
jgi:hypothetical protein